MRITAFVTLPEYDAYEIAQAVSEVRIGDAPKLRKKFSDGAPSPTMEFAAGHNDVLTVKIEDINPESVARIMDASYTGETERGTAITRGTPLRLLSLTLNGQPARAASSR